MPALWVWIDATSRMIIQQLQRHRRCLRAAAQQPELAQ
jgi:hypothetical protein